MKRCSLLALVLVTAAVPAWSQSMERRAQQFKAYLGSLAYSTFVAQKAMDNDKLLPPACTQRKLTGRRQLFAVYQTPRFIRTRKVPIRGAWAERIEVQRCGRYIIHNIYLTASPKRGLHAVAGFPGFTIARVGTQLRAGKLLIEDVRARLPRCRRMDIIHTARISKPSGVNRSWRENWTVYACGRRVRRTLQFTPAGRNTRIQILG